MERKLAAQAVKKENDEILRKQKAVAEQNVQAQRATLLEKRAVEAEKKFKEKE